MQSAATVWQENLSRRQWILVWRLVICVLGMLAGTTFAAPMIEVNTERLHLDLPPYVDVFEDKKGDMTFDEIKSEKLSHQFAPSSLTDLYFGYTDSAYWLRFEVDNQLDHDKAFIFEVAPADVELVDFYALDSRLDKTLFHKRSGSAVAFKLRDYDHPLNYFDLTIPAHATYTYYVRLESHRAINAQLTLSALREHFRHSGARDWWQGFLFGALFLLAVIHLGFAVVFRRKAFVYCGLVLMSMILIQGSWNGYFLQFLDADIYLLERQLILSVYISAALGLLFTRSYLDTHQRYPRCHRVLTALVGIVLAGIPCSWLFSSQTNVLLMSLVTVPATLFVCGVAVYSFLEGYRPARYFLIARTATLFMILAAVFSDRGLLPQGFVSAWGLSAAMVFEGVVFALAMVMQQWQRRLIETPGQGLPVATESASAVPVSAYCHELRTPISGVMGMAELLLDTPLTDQQRLQAETIYTSGKALLGVVKKMSDISALEGGNLVLVETSFEIIPVVESCIEHARQFAEQRNIELIYQVDEALAGFVKGDQEKLQQVLENLVSYGVRHLESGEILLTAKFQSQDFVRFEVISGRNTSVPEYAAAKALSSHPTSADAMNLALAKRFITLMGGELEMQARTDGGCRANFQVFLRRLRREHETGVQDYLVRGKRLLVVDDNDTCCKIVKQQASLWGMDVMVASSGKEALALLRAQADLNRAFDLMLADYDMPGMNGLELVEHISQERDVLKAKKLLVLILTGVSKMPWQLMGGHKDIHRVLYKPLSGKHLKQALIEALQQAAGKTV
jgi:signal transduction histidine kinase/ActR/RegA family two-component response regulator